MLIHSSSKTSIATSGTLTIPGTYTLRTNGALLLTSDTSVPEYIGALKINALILDAAGGAGGSGWQNGTGYGAGGGGSGGRTIVSLAPILSANRYTVVVGMQGLKSGTTGLAGGDSYLSITGGATIYIATGGGGGEMGYSGVSRPGVGGYAGTGTLNGSKGEDGSGGAGGIGANSPSGALGGTQTSDTRGPNASGIRGADFGAGGAGTNAGNAAFTSGYGGNGRVIYNMILAG